MLQEGCFNDLYTWDRKKIEALVDELGEEDEVISKALKLDRKAVMQRAYSNFLTLRSKTSSSICDAVHEVLQLNDVNIKELKECLTGISLLLSCIFICFI